MRAAAVVALVASLVANVYLAAGRGAPNALRPGAGSAAANGTGSAAPPRVPDSPCVQRLRVAARELNAVSRKIEAKLQPDERFERGTPDSVSPERLRPFLSEIFGSKYKYTFECRSHVCELNVNGDDFDWMQPLQEEGSRRALFDGASFSGQRAYLVMMEEARSRGWVLAQQVLQWIYESGEIARCRPKDPPPQGLGDLSVSIDVDADDHLIAAYSGALADIDVGACVRTALDAELARIPVPPDTVWPIEHDFELFR